MPYGCMHTAFYQELIDSDKLSQYEKIYFTKILDSSANEVELTSALERLSKMLAVHYGKAPIIIIDEYDTPVQEGYSKDFYDEIIGFMRNFFSGAFKDNKNLSYGFLTGILRIAQESIFSGLNNHLWNMMEMYLTNCYREHGLTVAVILWQNIYLKEFQIRFYCQQLWQNI